MIEESGRVVEITSKGILVETVRQSACGGCSAAKGCGQKVIASIGQGQRFEVLADNPQQLILHAGDGVVLGLDEGVFLKASSLAYLLPLIFMIVAALIADLLKVSDLMVAVAGFGGLASGLAALRWGVQAGSDHCQFHPEILRAQGSDTAVHS
ncbi:MAG: SoxR reducing system RseC family protein [Motiliproteus sp.]